ncbi:response regulator [Sphingomonas sp. Leaf412]|uniref:response regulator n=1 Tax=Sphingomonas sp. Leaf412 TaxID=1736370 RepID=UPI0009E8FA33|nr:response regulator [Sphingomonas sp. Leaf412]
MNALKVLYVDDDPDIRQIVALSLRRDPAVTAHFAASAEEALARIEGDASPDVVLADVMMPGMGGLALADALRAAPRTRDVPVIFVTARARESDMDAYRAHGAIGVIVKPFDPLHLADLVRTRLAAANALPTSDDGSKDGAGDAGGKVSSTVPRP